MLDLERMVYGAVDQLRAICPYDGSHSDPKEVPPERNTRVSN
jgi:hypothetical protein